MSILSGIGRVPSIFGSTATAIPNPIILTIPVDNNGSSVGGGTFDSISTGTWGFLESFTTYRIQIIYSVVNGVGYAPSALLSGSTIVQCEFYSLTSIYIQNLSISSNITMGTLVIIGQITTPDLSVYNQNGGNITIDSGWNYTPDTSLPLYTSGQILFEKVH